MQKIFIVAFVLVIIVLSANAQRTINLGSTRDTTAYYMVYEHQMAYSEQDAKFLRLIIRVKQGMYNVEDFFMDGKKRLTASTTINDKRIYAGLHGDYKEYYQNGSSKSVRKYNKGAAVGDAIDYYSNGKVLSIKNYDGYTIYLKEYSDTAGKILTQNGNGFWRSYTADLETIYEEGQVVNGQRNGPWKEFEANKVINLDYDMGKVRVDSTVADQPIKSMEEIDFGPSFKGGANKFADYMSKGIKNIQYARDNNIYGRVVVNFVVEKDGSITNARVTGSLQKYIDNEVLRNIKKAPLWHPATINGKPVRVECRVPIAFGFAQSEY